ncbi:hypothetical protein DRE_02396 [Drechslerella stenobrocha 248]|uniref:Checkpoint protein n=1 Tax=Drechslerella stenobrocha 248 TaxID=1043628 RepID=W7I867_9PEZI|nr:hypothetical protein DRE_02396 [Drechslerella stenobrocha 248]
MRFKAGIHNISLLTRLTGALSVVGKAGWLQLNDEFIQLTVLPEGNHSQVWSHISIDAVFINYKVVSASENIINLEIPLDTLHRSLKSAQSASTVSIRLTKKGTIPMLSLTITTESHTSMNPAIITQDIPVRVLAPQTVSHIHKPVVPRPETSVILPTLTQLRGITDRYVRMMGANGRVVLEGNMDGVLKMKAEADAVKVESEWRGLMNPAVGEDGEMEWEEVERDEDEEMAMTTQQKSEFARVTVDSKEWAKVVKVCGAGKRVVAWLCNNHALVVYVFMSDDGDNRATINYYVTSFAS